MSAQCIRLETNVKMVNDTFLEYLPFFFCQVLGVERKASSQISRGSQPLVMAEWWWLTATTSAYRWGSVATCFTVIAQKWIFRRVYSAVHSKTVCFDGPNCRFSPMMANSRCALGSEVGLQGSCKDQRVSLLTWTVTLWWLTMTIGGSASSLLMGSLR